MNSLSSAFESVMKHPHKEKKPKIFEKTCQAFNATIWIECLKRWNRGSFCPQSKDRPFKANNGETYILT